MSVKQFDFSAAILKWFRKHGRKDLPWQRDRTSYRVWLSEVMLQQTQVSTVIPYYLRFLERFPDVYSLAAASQEEVLSLWAGLGYYARGRNLHACAQEVVNAFGGKFPDTVEKLASLPGIGRSTAGAILSLSQGKRAIILDGNVKRVLSRYAMMEGIVTQGATEKALWALAEQLTPSSRAAEYNQAMMDMGATLCTRSRPDCGRCPVSEGCLAYGAGRQADFPQRKSARPLPRQERSAVVLVSKQGEVFLERRPPVGIWGGLLSLPEIDATDEVLIREELRRRWGIVNKPRMLAPIEHTFSHYHLRLYPVVASCYKGGRVAEAHGLWYKPGAGDELGLPSPIQRFLAGLAGQVECGA